MDGDNTIVIWVSNEVPSKKGLLNWMDQFGGFYRSIELETTSLYYIDDVGLSPMSKIAALILSSSCSRRRILPASFRGQT